MDQFADVADFAMRPVPEIRFGHGRAGALADDTVGMAEPGRPIVLIADGWLAETGVAARVSAPLEAAGADVRLFAEVKGEPKQALVEAACDFVRGADAGLVVSVGGGSAMDVGKIAATVARGDEGPAAYAMDGLPLPKDRVPSICVPSTAGTGSELSSTNIFTNSAGKKVWVWGSETKPGRVVLDPDLTVSMPPDLTAWTGLDAFVHALETSTNVYRHAANDLYAHRALGLIAGALPRAVAEPGNTAARACMLMGSAYAGMALDNCSAAMAHNISHALAALAPVHHGLATGLGLAVIIDWQAAADTGPFAAAARACGLAADAKALAEWYTTLLDRIGVARRLPPAFKDFTAADLAHEMRAPETEPMRRATARPVGDADVDRFAGSVMAMA